MNCESTAAGKGRKKPRGGTVQASLEGGHFYVFMKKKGHCESITNYVPFEQYAPDRRRLDRWREKGKLSDEVPPASEVLASPVALGPRRSSPGQVWLEYRAELTVGFSSAMSDFSAKEKYKDKKATITAGRGGCRKKS